MDARNTTLGKVRAYTNTLLPLGRVCMQVSTRISSGLPIRSAVCEHPRVVVWMHVTHCIAPRIMSLPSSFTSISGCCTTRRLRQASSPPSVSDPCPAAAVPLRASRWDRFSFSLCTPRPQDIGDGRVSGGLDGNIKSEAKAIKRVSLSSPLTLSHTHHKSVKVTRERERRREWVLEPTRVVSCKDENLTLRKPVQKRQLSMDLPSG